MRNGGVHLVLVLVKLVRTLNLQVNQMQLWIDVDGSDTLDGLQREPIRERQGSSQFDCPISSNLVNSEHVASHLPKQRGDSVDRDVNDLDTVNRGRLYLIRAGLKTAQFIRTDDLDYPDVAGVIAYL
ncbi:hypothetical protein D3C85_740830 [compost metagenome]